MFIKGISSWKGIFSLFTSLFSCLFVTSVDNKYENPYRWILYLSAEELLVALSDLSRESEAQGPCVNRPLESTGVMVRLLTQGPHSAPPQSGLHPEQRACQYPSTQPKITLPGLEKLVFCEGTKDTRRKQRISDAEWRSA